MCLARRVRPRLGVLVRLGLPKWRMRHRLAETGAEKVTAVEIAAGDDVTLVGGPGDLAEWCAEFFRRRRATGW